MSESNVIPFKRKLAPRDDERIEIWVPDRNGGEPKIFTVPPKDMYWWALILDSISVFSRTWDGCVYFYSDPYGFMNESYARRNRCLEMHVDRTTLASLLTAVPYTFVSSLGGRLTDTDYHLVYNNALVHMTDELTVEYELGLFVTPTDDPAIYKITYVESPK